MDARKAIREVIESIPNLFGITRGVTIGAEGQTETVLYTQAQVADIIASIPPRRPQDQGACGDRTARGWGLAVMVTLAQAGTLAEQIIRCNQREQEPYQAVDRLIPFGQ